MASKFIWKGKIKEKKLFEKIIGNEEITSKLEKSISNNRTSHSYMFIGQEGIGKKIIAKEFAKMLLCLEQEKYCNKCKSCIEFDSNNHPDFSLIEPEEKKIKIDQIRKIQEKVAERPIISNRKIYIIDEADTMTKEAQNCLLKTLEEPPQFVTIILIGTNENNFLPTIKSRCVILHFRQLKDEEIQKFFFQEKKEEVSSKLIEMSQGSIGKALQLQSKIELYDIVENIILNLDKVNILDILKQSEQLYKAKEDIFGILDYMNTICIKKSKENIKYINAINKIEDTKQRIKMNSNYDMSIDDLLFNIWEEVNEKSSWN